MTKSTKAFNIWGIQDNKVEGLIEATEIKVTHQSQLRGYLKRKIKHNKANTTKATCLGQLIYYFQGPQLDATNVNGSEPLRSSIKDYNIPPRIAIPLSNKPITAAAAMKATPRPTI